MTDREGQNGKASIESQSPLDRFIDQYLDERAGRMCDFKGALDRMAKENVSMDRQEALLRFVYEVSK